jgi:hypothetical protein
MAGATPIEAAVTGAAAAASAEAAAAVVVGATPTEFAAAMAARAAKVFWLRLPSGRCWRVVDVGKCS